MEIEKFEQRNNSGTLFRNKRKLTGTHPDYQGNCRINGVDYWMNAWLKTSKAGNKFMSFSFKPKQDSGVSLKEEMNDSIPF